MLMAGLISSAKNGQSDYAKITHVAPVAMVSIPAPGTNEGKP